MIRTTTVLILLVFTCFACGQMVAGTTTYIPLWRRLTSAYVDLSPETNMSYVAAGTFAAALQLASGADLAFSEISLSELYRASNNSFFLQPKAIPFLAQPYVIIYNIPEVSSSPMILDGQTTADIMLGKITKWNDPALVALNPKLAQVNRTITNVVRNTESGTTYVFTKALSGFSKEWADTYGPVLTWPSQLNNVTTIKYTLTHVFASFAEVFSTPYSISVATYPFFYSIGFAKGVNYAVFKTTDGRILYPNAQNMQAALSRVTLDPVTMEATGFDSNSEWPMIGMGYVILNTSVAFEKCKVQQEILRFIRWSVESNTAFTISTLEGFYVPLNHSLATQFLDSITCAGQPLLKEQSFFSARTGQIALICVFFLFFGFSVFISFFLIKFKTKIATIYAAILLVGLFFSGVGASFFVVEPNSDGICSFRWFFLNLGIILLCGGVFSRSYQLKKIHMLIKSGKYKATKKLNHTLIIGMIFGTLILIHVILFLVMQLAFPFRSSLIITDSIRRTGEFRCSSSLPSFWLISQSCFIFILLLLGIYSMYSTWGMSSSVDDTRVNIFTIFVCLVTVAIADIMAVLAISSDSQWSWWAVGIVLTWSLCMMGSVFIPRLVKSNFRSKTPTSAGSSVSSKASTRNSHNAKTTETQ